MVEPQLASPPNDTSMKPVRLRQGANLREVEHWLLAFIGPGRSGDFTHRHVEDQWFLGVDRGHPTIWFEKEKHFMAFLFELNSGGLGSTVKH